MSTFLDVVVVMEDAWAGEDFDEEGAARGECGRVQRRRYAKGGEEGSPESCALIGYADVVAAVLPLLKPQHSRLIVVPAAAPPHFWSSPGPGASCSTINDGSSEAGVVETEVPRSLALVRWTWALGAREFMWVWVCHDSAL